MKKKNVTDNKLVKKGENTLKEFKEFISKGNIFDMAVGVIIGGHDFTGLVVKVQNAEIAYGTFIQNIVDFLIVALCIFVVVKAMAKFRKKEEEAPAEPSEEILLLREIRDSLKKK